MNMPCHNCKGQGIVRRDGKGIGNGQPYSLTCPTCNGVGHHRMPRDVELALPED